MKINYEYTKKDLKKYLLKSRTINNIILLAIGISIYLFLTINKISISFLPLYIIALLIFIVLINILYIILYIKVNEMLNKSVYGKYILELTPNKYSITLNKLKVDYKYKDIKRIIVKKNSFIIRLKHSREYLTFEKRLFNEEDYNKVMELFKSRIN